MLSHIHIKNFAIIEEIDSSFEGGLSVITGETGSGKSIIIEAISLALGSRADSTYVRSGTDKAIVEVAFDDCPDFVFELLNEDPSSCEGQIIIRREINANGKSSCKINGSLVSLATLKQISAYLADIHGQYDHQSLLNEESHINLLDLYGAKEIGALKDELAKDFEIYHRAKNAYEALVASEDAYKQEAELKAFQLQELKSANLIIGEDEELREQISTMQNAGQIFANFAKSYELLYESSGSIIEKLSSVNAFLDENSGFNKKFESFKEISDDVYYRLEDLASEIRCERDKIDFSKSELDDAISREIQLNELCRKYKRSLAELIAYRDALASELSSNLDLDAHRKELFSTFEAAQKIVMKKASELSKMRKASAKKLEAEIEKQLSELSFNSARFRIFVDSDEKNLSSDGYDSVQFLLSANRGEIERPLSKIASGGEISRIMLAFKKALADFDKIPTMIFDEIDTGISGIAASVVGKKLREISNAHQIICITHLPQIAACSDIHYEIKKSSNDYVTKVELLRLSHEEKVKELARLLGGTSITDATIKNAEDLILYSH